MPETYIQGQTVKLTGSFFRTDTGAAIVPDAPKVRIQPPTEDAFESDDLVHVSGGEFYYLLDTSPEGGEWNYEFFSDDEGEAAAEASYIRVRPHIVIPD